MDFLIGTSVMAWALFFRIAIHNRAKLKNTRAKHTLSYMFCFALAFTLRTDPFFEAIGRISNIPNLAWIIAYLFSCIGFHFTVLISNSLKSIDWKFMWIERLLFLGSLVLPTIIFAGWVWDTPSVMNVSFPITQSQATLMMPVYVYYVYVCGLMIYVYGAVFKETRRDLKLRSFALLITAILAIIYFVFTLVTHFWFIFNPSIVEYQFAHIAQRSVVVLLAFSTVTWMFFFILGEQVSQKAFSMGKKFDHKGLFLYYQYLSQDVSMVSPHILLTLTLDQRIEYTTIRILDVLKKKRIENGGKHGKYDVNDDYGSDDFEKLKSDFRNRGYHVYLRKFLAKVFSIIAHPFILAPITLTLFIRHNIPDVVWQDLFMWVVVPTLVLVLPVLIYILQKMSIGEYKNIDVSDRQNRNKLFVFVGFVMILFLATLLLIEMPLTVLLPYLMAVIAIVIGIITTRLFAKISFHGIASAGSTFLLLSTPYFLPFLLLSMGSGWSRMELGRHTKNEVVLGYIVGSFVTILMLFIFY